MNDNPQPQNSSAGTPADALQQAEQARAMADQAISQVKSTMGQTSTSQPVSINYYGVGGGGQAPPAQQPTSEIKQQSNEVKATGDEAAQKAEELQSKAEQTELKLEQMENQVQQQKRAHKMKTEGSPITIVGYTPEELINALIRPPDPSARRHGDPTKNNEAKQKLQTKEKHIQEAKKQIRQVREEAKDFNDRQRQNTKSLEASIDSIDEIDSRDK